MKGKLFVFFGIILIGIIISLFTLTKCEKRDKTGELAAPATSEDGGTAMAVPSSPSTGAQASAASTAGTPADAEAAAGGTAAGDAANAGGGATPKVAAMRDPEEVAAAQKDSTPAQREKFETGTSTPGKVAGGMANKANERSYEAFIKAAGGEENVPEAVRERVKKIIEDPKLKLDPNKPMFEVAKTRDSVRWTLNFVPVEEGNGAKAETVVMDIEKKANNEYEVTKVGVQPTMKEVIKAVQDPATSPSEVKVDSLTIAQAFSEAVLSEDFVSARKLSSPAVTDERIAGLMIALEDGKFEQRSDRPLVVTFARDNVSWVLSRVQAAEQTSEFALELENKEQWSVNGLTFGKVISALAKEAEGPYSPIVEDPTGGESLVIYFDFDDSGLTKRADNQLKIVANILKQDRSRRIRITGHADALGSDEYNSKLSQKRAESIRQGIIDRGALPDQVITEGYGSTRPRKPNFLSDGTDNPTGRSENRRAEVYLDF